MLHFSKLIIPYKLKQVSRTSDRRVAINIGSRGTSLNRLSEKNILKGEKKMYEYDVEIESM